jgi:hypothetical protein
MSATLATPRAIARREAPRPLATLLAANGPVVLQQRDRIFGTHLIGGQGSGKSSAMLRLALSDIRDPNSAVILIDPKSEVSKKFLQLIPPNCGKRIWYLDLARPAFGMNPLTMYPDQDFASEASAVADGVVEALLDVNEGQIMQASRDLLMRSVMGALAIAKQEGRPAWFEDVYALLQPTDLGKAKRAQALSAVSRIPNMDQTASFFKDELPARLSMSQSSTVDRLAAPANKISGIVGVPSLRVALGHPTNVTMETIIQARDILIINGSMDKVGEANAQAILHFIFRQIHRQMQRQVHVPESQRARVALIADEAHYLMSRNVVRQIATHRAAGLDVTIAHQFFSQLGAAAESASVTQEIREGVQNLMRNRFLFRLGLPEDAESATRIAMAVYSTMIRGDDPTSRAHMRVTPEVVLNLPQWHCLASWVSNGAPAPSFIGQTYPMPETSDSWAKLHLDAQAERVGPYPTDLALVRAGLYGDDSVEREASSEDAASDIAAALSTLTPPPAGGASAPARANTAPSARDTTDDVFDAAALDLAASIPDDPADAGPILEAHPLPASASSQTPQPAVPNQMTAGDMPPAGAGEKPGATIYRPDPSRAPKLDDSPARSLFGNAPRGQGALFDAPFDPDAEAPESIRDLAFIDRVNEIGDLEMADTPQKVGRMYEQDWAILKFLDRAGVVLPSLIRASALPGRSESQARRTMGKLHKQGLVAKRKVGIRERSSTDGQLPSAYELTRAGFDLAQERGVIPDKREFRATEVKAGAMIPHDHHALGWVVALNRLVGDVVTDNWRTPRYSTGRFVVPHVGAGHKRRQIEAEDIQVTSPFAIFDLPEQFSEIKPDVAAEIKVDSVGLRFDLLLEYHHHTNTVTNLDEKFPAYDAFLTGWCLEHNRFRSQGTRPVVVFVASDPRDLLTIARKADAGMSAAVGLQGTNPQNWYYAARDHVFFALEEDVHRGRLNALALQPLPPKLRAELGDEGMELRRVSLLPPSMTVAAQKKARQTS